MLVKRTEIHLICLLETAFDATVNAVLEYSYNPERSLRVAAARPGPRANARQHLTRPGPQANATRTGPARPGPGNALQNLTRPGLRANATRIGVARPGPSWAAHANTFATHWRHIGDALGAH